MPTGCDGHRRWKNRDAFAHPVHHSAFLIDSNECRNLGSAADCALELTGQHRRLFSVFNVFRVHDDVADLIGSEPGFGFGIDFCRFERNDYQLPHFILHVHLCHKFF